MELHRSPNSILLSNFIAATIADDMEIWVIKEKISKDYVLHDSVPTSEDELIYDGKAGDLFNDIN